MTTTESLDRAVTDPIGLMTDLVANAESELGSEAIRTVVTAVAGKSEDRLAGLLLLLYAQWPAVISRLAVDQIEETDGAVRLRLGAVPVDQPGPVAELALQQVAVLRSHAALALTDSPWLFPGGRPGRPISVWAMGKRLRKLGIRLAETRSTALFQLATELPATVLARTLGIDITVAVTWQRAAAGDWAAYAAEVSRRTSLQPPIQEPGVPT